MFIEMDVQTKPYPRPHWLRGSGDFGLFRVMVPDASKTSISPQALRQLPVATASNPAREPSVDGCSPMRSTEAGAAARATHGLISNAGTSAQGILDGSEEPDWPFTAGAVPVGASVARRALAAANPAAHPLVSSRYRCDPRT